MKNIYFLACVLSSVVCMHVVAAPATETFSIAANQAEADKTGTVPNSQGSSERADKANPQATPPGSKQGTYPDPRERTMRKATVPTQRLVKIRLKETRTQATARVIVGVIKLTDTH